MSLKTVVKPHAKLVSFVDLMDQDESENIASKIRLKIYNLMDSAVDRNDTNSLKEQIEVLRMLEELRGKAAEHKLNFQLLMEETDYKL